MDRSLLENIDHLVKSSLKTQIDDLINEASQRAIETIKIENRLEKISKNNDPSKTTNTLFDIFPVDLQKLSMIYLSNQDISKHPCFEKHHLDWNFQTSYLNSHFHNLRSDYARLHTITYDQIKKWGLKGLTIKPLNVDIYNDRKPYESMDDLNNECSGHGSCQNRSTSSIYYYQGKPIESLTKKQLNRLWDKVIHIFVRKNVPLVDIRYGDLVILDLYSYRIFRFIIDLNGSGYSSIDFKTITHDATRPRYTFCISQSISIGLFC